MFFDLRSGRILDKTNHVLDGSFTISLARGAASNFFGAGYSDKRSDTSRRYQLHSMIRDAQNHADAFEEASEDNNLI